jgi:hypothetical protein
MPQELTDMIVHEFIQKARNRFPVDYGFKIMCFIPHIAFFG